MTINDINYDQGIREFQLKYFKNKLILINVVV
jgi:hypothetical protein